MANKKIFLGILAMVLVLEIMAVGCASTANKEQSTTSADIELAGTTWKSSSTGSKIIFTGDDTASIIQSSPPQDAGKPSLNGNIISGGGFKDGVEITGRSFIFQEMTFFIDQKFENVPDSLNGTVWTAVTMNPDNSIIAQFSFSEDGNCQLLLSSETPCSYSKGGKGIIIKYLSNGFTLSASIEKIIMEGIDHDFYGMNLYRADNGNLLDQFIQEFTINL